jgi:hypothetical protein
MGKDYTFFICKIFSRNVYSKVWKPFKIHNRKHQRYYMSFTEKPLDAVNIFISYADEDEQSMLELEKHLGSLVRSNTITIFRRGS